MAYHFDTQFEFDAERDGRIDEDEPCRMCNDFPCRCLMDDDTSEPLGNWSPEEEN